MSAIRKLIFHLLIWLFIPNAISGQILSGNAVAGEVLGFAATAGPYLGFGSTVFARYEFRSLKEREPKHTVSFPSAGIGLLSFDGEGGLIIPVEYYIGFDYIHFGIYTSLGFIINTNEYVLEPILLPTIHGATRLKLPKSNFFIDFEYRLFQHYRYSGINGNTFSPPYQRDGWGTGLGVGISIGRYLGGKRRPGAAPGN